MSHRLVFRWTSRLNCPVECRFVSITFLVFYNFRPKKKQDELYPSARGLVSKHWLMPRVLTAALSGIIAVAVCCPAAHMHLIFNRKMNFSLTVTVAVIVVVAVSLAGSCMSHDVMPLQTTSPLYIDVTQHATKSYLCCLIAEFITIKNS